MIESNLSYGIHIGGSQALLIFKMGKLQKNWYIIIMYYVGKSSNKKPLVHEHSNRLTESLKFPRNSNMYGGQSLDF